jgi:DNA-binding transcriptional LysR family regulator
MDMDRDIELRHLRYFVAVGEELHFSRAAKRLNVSQPPLSQQIRRLEEILGYPLLARTSRSVSLTAAGQEFLERARRTLRNVQRDIEEARSIGRGEVGSLHVGFVGSGVLVTLPAIFQAYRAAYPRVRLHLHESFTASVLEGLENGSLDAGILRDADAREGLHMQCILSEPYVGVVPVGHKCARQRSITPAALREDPFVYYPRSAGETAYEKPLAIFEAHGFRPRVVQEAGNWLTILRLVGAGLGVTIAPACVRCIAPPEVRCVSLRGVKVRSDMALAWTVGEKRPIVERFLQVARAKARMS